MKTGLIMEGGALRGIFTAGVIDVFMENQIEFDGAVGVSAGAAFGCNFKSKQIGRVVRYNIDNCKNPKFCSFRSLLFTGDMFGAKFCYETIPYETDKFDWDTYIKNPMEFHVVATDIESGETVYKKCDTLDKTEMEWMRASASMPLVSRIVNIEGRKLLDGGISDPIPLKYFEKAGYDRNVLILTQPYDYVKKPSEHMGLVKLKYRKYPKLIELLINRHTVYNGISDYIKKKEAEGEILVIRPDAPLPISRVEHNADIIKATYDLGRAVGSRYVEKVNDFLKK